MIQFLQDLVFEKDFPLSYVEHLHACETDVSQLCVKQSELTDYALSSNE